VGRGALSLDPYLLRAVEAANLSLVAGKRGGADCDSAWSRESVPLPTRPVKSPASAAEER
jgi:hypothetical protein